MEAKFSSTAVSSSHSTVMPKIGTLATMAPAFFLVGAGAVAYADPTPHQGPEHSWLQYDTAFASRTKPVLETLQYSSMEQQVIQKLDSIFEELLSSQRDLDTNDHKAIAAELWNLYK